MLACCVMFVNGLCCKTPYLLSMSCNDLIFLGEVILSTCMSGHKVNYYLCEQIVLDEITV